MLTVYAGKRPKGLEIEDFNDAWFGRNCAEVNFADKEIQQIIRDIDDVSYIDGYRVEAKFQPGMVVSVMELSTGCKTALNICSFKKNTFNLAECGDNALDVIFNFNSGRCFMPYFMLPNKFENKVKLVIAGKEYIVDNFSKLEDIVYNVKEWDLGASKKN